MYCNNCYASSVSEASHAYAELFDHCVCYTCHLQLFVAHVVQAEALTTNSWHWSLTLLRFVLAYYSCHFRAYTSICTFTTYVTSGKTDCLHKHVVDNKINCLVSCVLQQSAGVHVHDLLDRIHDACPMTVHCANPGFVHVQLVNTSAAVLYAYLWFLPHKVVVFFTLVKLLLSEIAQL